MNKRVVFSLPGILVFVFAVLVSSCYNLNVAPSVTSVHFDRTDITLIKDLDRSYLGTGDLVLMLRPSIAGSDVENIEWKSNGVFVDFLSPQDIEFNENGQANAKIIVNYGAPFGENDMETVFVHAEVTLKDGNIFYAWCRVLIKDES